MLCHEFVISTRQNYFCTVAVSIKAARLWCRLRGQTSTNILPIDMISFRWVLGCWPIKISFDEQNSLNGSVANYGGI